MERQDTQDQAEVAYIDMRIMYIMLNYIHTVRGRATGIRPTI